MDLKSALKPGDLFISYWLSQELRAVTGDREKIHAVETIPLRNLSDLVAQFEAQVTRPEHYVRFVAEQFRPATWPDPAPPGFSMAEILASLGSILVTPAFRERVRNGDYRRLLIFPDGILHALPIHLLTDLVAESGGTRAFPEGTLYAPSASSYVYAGAKRRKEVPRRAVVLEGDAQDPLIAMEAESVSLGMPCPAAIITRMDDLRKISPEADILYIATHGRASGTKDSRTLETRGISAWSLLFDNTSLGPKDFFEERIKLPRGAVVILSACSVGHLMSGPVHELEGLVQALFYAGAATVLAARWPIFSGAAQAVFAGTIDNVYGGQMSYGAALHEAVRSAMAREDLNRIMAGPEAHAFFWGPFALLGCGD